MSKFKIISPQATINYCDNPSFEGASSTGWTAVAPNTIGSYQDQQQFGDYSLRCSYVTSGGNTMAQYAIPTGILTAGDKWTVSSWVRTFGGSWSGDTAYWDTTLSDATETVVSKWDKNENEDDVWYKIETRFTVGTDTSGSIRLLKTGTLINGQIIYIDGVNLEKNDRATTFCDGDQPGCRWLGARHSSRSERSGTSREGGTILDIEDDLGFSVQNISGMGFPQVENISRDRALLDGTEFLRTKVRGPMIELVSTVVGVNLADYHSKRADLLAALAPDPQDGAQPVKIWYQGATEWKVKGFRLASGFEMNKGGGFDETLSIRLEATEPYWGQIGISRQIADDSELKNHGGLLVRSNADGEWTNLGVTNSSHTTFTEIHHILHDPRTGKVYISGNFTGFAGVSGANHIVAYDIQSETFELVGPASTFSSQVRGMCLRPQGGIFVTGAFTNVGTASGDGLAYWDGTNWSGVTTSPGASASFKSCAWGKDGYLYVAGPTADIGGDTAADGLAYYDFSNDTWNDVGGFSHLATEWVAVAPNGDIYVTGNWNHVDWETQNANDIARWDGTKWWRLGTGLVSGLITHVFIDDNGDVYPSGGYTTAGGITVGNAAKWNGSNWYPLGDGFSTGASYMFCRNGEDIVSVGWQSDAGGLDLPGPGASWDGSVWRPLDMEGEYISQQWNAVADVNGELWIGADSVASIWYTNESWNCEVGGTAKSYPQFEFESRSAPADEEYWIVSITNETTGARLWLNYRLMPNETLTVNLEPGNRNMISNLYGNRWEMLPSSDLADFYFLPGQTNIVTMFGYKVGGGSGSSWPTIRWKNQWWGID